MNNLIEKNTPMLLFRFNNYSNCSFIKEHKKILESKKYVWMMKVGRLCKQSRLDNVTQNGGYIILKAPIKDGGSYYIGKYTEVLDSFPDKDQCMPSYYKNMKASGDLIGLEIQSFKIVSIIELNSDEVKKLALSINDRKVLEVIYETRTAVMFVYNTENLCVEI